jgi:hypothetical protein
MLKDILQNQIALALFVFLVISILVLLRLDGTGAKEIIIQLITAIGSLVSGVAIERSKNQRATDVPTERKEG